MRRLRWVICGLALLGATPQARGADLSDFGGFLRGSSTAPSSCCITWNGFYAGGHIGATWAGTDFSGATRSLVAFMLRNTAIENEQHVSDWATLGKQDTSGSSWGGFAGYQAQWDVAVIGIEGGYSRTNMHMSQSDGLRRVFSTSNGYSNDVQVTGTASARLTDYGTIRLKAGWAIGNFLPYGFVGFGLGRVDVSRSATVVATGFDTTGSGNPPYSFTQTSTEARTGVFTYGYTAGAGLDVALMQNVFVRGEYEYIYFGDINDLKMGVHTLRVGAGLKF
jgi:outer membrane immunogenic protein